jgi:hypothetical protein
MGSAIWFIVSVYMGEISLVSINATENQYKHACMLVPSMRATNSIG